jgi:filamentous hemagglutinin family protein
VFGGLCRVAVALSACWRASTQPRSIACTDRNSCKDRRSCKDRNARTDDPLLPALRSAARSLHNRLLATSALIPLGVAAALANPQGGQVVGGAAQIQGQGTANVTVTQTTDKAIVNWHTFNIGAGETTRFVQPSASSVVLNRVTGGLGPSSLYGSLLANGRVFLVNPDGILIGRDAVIDTAGFLATTSDIGNDDFMAGRYQFYVPGANGASIVNMGTITSQTGGFAALVAPGVRNAGTITARLGRVGLASANTFALDFYGDGLIKLQLDDSIATQVRDVATGQPLDALVKNEGTIRTAGGRVELTAVAARTLVDSVINNTGTIEANTVGLRNGMIVLGAATAGAKPADAPVQTVRVSGELSAAGRRRGTAGGTVQITGESIEVTGARIDVSGRAGGGIALIGGDIGGGAFNATAHAAGATLRNWWVPTASTVTLDGATLIDASARRSGDGGTVVVWADQATRFHGTILARGGAAFGNGGFVEVSGKERLGFAGLADTSAPNGRQGMLLLDPEDIQIGGTGPWVVTVAALEQALLSNDVAIVTGSSSGLGNGDITVAQSFNWGASNTSLMIAAYRNFVVKNGVTIRNTGSGSLNIGAGVDTTNSASWTLTGAGSIFFEGSGKIDFSNSLGLVNFGYNPVSGSYAAPNDFSGRVLTNSNWGNSFPESAPLWLTQFSQFTPSMWVRTASDLQNVSQNLGGNYLVIDIDAASIASFTPLGTVSNPFTGRFTGIQNTIFGSNGSGGKIRNLNIEVGGQDYVGLFGATGSGAHIRNIALENVNVIVSGNFDAAGALVGLNNGLISQASVTGHIQNQSPGVSTMAALGGLVGANSSSGHIGLSSASVSLTVRSPLAGYVDGGGLAGANSGWINGAFTNGSIQGESLSSSNRSYLGGLVGWHLGGGIHSSYSLTSITSSTGNTTAGGLVGDAEGSTPSIFASYAAGAINVTGPFTIVGGLIGSGASTVTAESYWDPSATGVATSPSGAAHSLNSSLPTPLTPFFSPPSDGNYPLLHWQTASLSSSNPTVLQPSPVTPSTPPDQIGSPPANTINQTPVNLTSLTPPADPPANNPLPPDPPPGDPPAGNPQQNQGQGPGGGPGNTPSGNPGAPPQGPLRAVLGPNGEQFSSIPPIGETRFLSNEVVLNVNLNVTPAQIQAIAKQLGLTIVTSQTIDALGQISYRFTIPGGRSVTDIILALEANSIVAVAQPNYVFNLVQPTTDGRGDFRADPSQYSARSLNLEQAHRIASGNNVLVAVIDSGVDTAHPDLRNAIAGSFDAVGAGEPPHSHGTAMAGAIVQRGQLLGVAPNAKVLAIRAFSEQNNTAEGTTFGIVKAIDHAVAQGARIINMSFAGPRDPTLERALRVARDKGSVLIAAAGNAGPKSAPLYPGADPNVIAVTAIDAGNRLFRQANQGGYVALAAPGVDVIAPAPRAAYQMSTGTSIATAHVSGVAALLLERDPTLKPADVRAILLSTAADLGPRGRDDQFGWGLVDAHRALMAVGQPIPAIEPVLVRAPSPSRPVASTRPRQPAARPASVR